MTPHTLARAHLSNAFIQEKLEKEHEAASSKK
jgi:hypothetical protein